MSAVLECDACGFSRAYLQGVGMGIWSGYQNLLTLLSPLKRERLKEIAPFEKVRDAQFQRATYKCNRCNCPNERLDYQVELKKDFIISPKFSCGYCKSSDIEKVDLYKISTEDEPEIGDIGYFACPKCNSSPMKIGCEIDWD